MHMEHEVSMGLGVFLPKGSCIISTEKLLQLIILSFPICASFDFQALLQPASRLWSGHASCFVQLHADSVAGAQQNAEEPRAYASQGAAHSFCQHPQEKINLSNPRGRSLLDSHQNVYA
jgi:hypothetical protein